MKALRVAGLILVGLSFSVIEAWAATTPPPETAIDPGEKIEDGKKRPKMSNEITTQDTAKGTQSIPGKKKASRRTDVKENPAPDAGPAGANVEDIRE